MWEQFTNIIEHIEVGQGALSHAADWIGRYKKPLLVSDVNTYAVAGHELARLLNTADEFVFPDKQLKADENAVGRLMAAYQPGMDLFVAVGSGTICDLCKFVSFRVKIPMIAVATAPSMDGFASIGAAMTLGGVKITPPAQCARAIFCDTDIMAKAPMHMIQAGFGDIIGKYTAAADWKLSSLLTGEEHNEEIAQMIETALEKCVESAAGLPCRRPESIERLTEALILSGIAMSLHGDSRPASGTEHHLSHFWEMKLYQEKRQPVPHGTTVAIGTVCALKLWESLPEKPPCLLKTPERNIEQIIEEYGEAGREMVKEDNPAIDIDELRAKWTEIKKIAKALPSSVQITALLKNIGALYLPGQVGIHSQMLASGVKLARERKKTFTLLQLLGNLSLLDYAAELLSEQPVCLPERIKCFILDMDGTICMGDSLLPGVPEFLERAEQAGLRVVYYTNNSSRGYEQTKAKLERLGLPEAEVLTASQVMLNHLKKHHAGQRHYVMGTPGLISDFSMLALDEENPEVVVIGFDTSLSYEKLNKVCRFIRGGAKVYGINTDYNCPIQNGYMPDCGSICAAVTASTGADIEFFGKPSRHTLNYICERTALSPKQLCFVGDRLYTDIAVAGGDSYSVLVLTGESRAGDIAGSPFLPDIVVESIDVLKNLII